MGSLPELTERDRRPPLPRPAAVRTHSDPHRNRTVVQQIPGKPVCKKEWPWKKTKTPSKVPITSVTTRRRDSVASSVGAASVRRLITRQPPKLPKPLLRRFSLLCISSCICATSLLPFTAYAGAEAGAMPLAVMHVTAAIVAPFAPHILQKTGIRIVVALAHFLVFVLLFAHTISTPITVLLLLYALCGFMLSPMYLALAVSATNLAQAAGDESKRKVALRRALRALRGAQDIGLLLGSVLLGGALVIWPENLVPLEQTTLAPPNVTIPRWPPPEDYFLDDDYEEQTCGSAGCPDTQSLAGTALSAEGRRILVTVWAALALISVVLAVYGASPTPAPPPDTRSVFRDIRALLGVPMGLFIGLQQGFIYTSYVKWYGVCVGGWNCAWGALCGAGVLQTVSAITLSMAAARGRRGALAAGGAAAHASLVLALLRWRAAKTDIMLPSVAAAAWGACGSLWDVLQSGICIGGAGWRGPWSIILSARHAGLALACTARASVCARTQLATLAATLAAALVTHAALELKLRKHDLTRHKS